MKILCIDGGGIRGVFAVAILKEIEQEYKCSVSDLFDMVAGTSTGSIIATSVVLKKNMSEVLESYSSYGKKIFVRKAKIGLFKSVYSDEYLRHYLHEAFGERKLNDINKPLLIPAVDATHGKPYVHRSNYGHHDSEDLSIHLWDAVLSSCSAPVYFPPNNIKNKFLSVDGGLWANNPSLVCLTDAIDFFNKEMTDVQILSIGTGQQNINYTINGEKYWGIKQWLPLHFPSLKITPKLIDLALNLSSESVSYHCQLLLGKNYLRLNKELGDEIPFDEVDSMDHLIELGEETYLEMREEIIKFINI